METRFVTASVGVYSLRASPARSRWPHSQRSLPITGLRSCRVVPTPTLLAGSLD